MQVGHEGSIISAAARPPLSCSRAVTASMVFLRWTRTSRISRNFVSPTCADSYTSLWTAIYLPRNTVTVPSCLVQTSVYLLKSSSCIIMSCKAVWFGFFFFFGWLIVFFLSSPALVQACIFLSVSSASMSKQALPLWHTYLVSPAPPAACAPPRPGTRCTCWVVCPSTCPALFSSSSPETTSSQHQNCLPVCFFFL